MLFSVISYSFDQLYVSLAYCSIQQNIKSSNYFSIPGCHDVSTDKQSRQKCINKVIIRCAFSIESYFIRQLLVKNFCEIFARAPRVVAPLNWSTFLKVVKGLLC